MAKANQPRRALLILSDGMDNYSRYSKSELLRVALEAGNPVAVVTDGVYARIVGKAAFDQRL